jgi:hypothetical protein
MIRKTLRTEHSTLCLPAGWVVRPCDIEAPTRWLICENGTVLDGRPGCEAAFKRALEIIENRRRHRA